MIDASAIVEFLLRTDRGLVMWSVVTDPDADLRVPCLCDVEVVSALRGLVGSGALEVNRARSALTDYLDLPLGRHGHTGLLERAFELRASFSSYDAAYVALAEALGAELLSGDGRLVASVRSHTSVEVPPADGR